MRWLHAAFVLLCLVGCGVQGQSAAERVAATEQSAALGASSAPTPAARVTQVTVYLVEAGRLVRQDQAAERSNVEQALRSLLGTPTPEGPRRSTVPTGTTVRALDVRGEVLTLDLSDHFTQVRGPDQLLAVAQLVWTATEFPPVRRVALLVDGTPLDVPVDQGAVTRGPTSRADYASLAPPG